jgi:GT2 family glycosyltransferase
MEDLTVGVVVPTLGNRLDYLVKSLTSIRSAGHCLIYVVCPQPKELEQHIEPTLYDKMLLDPGSGLSAAINFGIRALPESVHFVNWLGDDDLLASESITVARSALESDEDISFVYGRCQYIDEVGNDLWLNKSGRWASALMRFGPQLVPQPGALFRRDKYEEVGGLNPELRFAFDLDLFIGLSRIGKTRFVPQTLAKFRWHQDSLSVSGRANSVAEASSVRVRALPARFKSASRIWEIPLQFVILHSGAIVRCRRVS